VTDDPRAGLVDEFLKTHVIEDNLGQHSVKGTLT